MEKETGTLNFVITGHSSWDGAIQGKYVAYFSEGEVRIWSERAFTRLGGTGATATREEIREADSEALEFTISKIEEWRR